MTSKREVILFYSRSKDPNHLPHYSEGFRYLHKIGVPATIIDVDKNPRIALRHHVSATPLMVIHDGKKKYSYHGIIAGLKVLLMRDLHGKTVVHMLTFKSGRELGKKIKVKKTNIPAPKRLEQEIRTALGKRGVGMVKILALDKKTSSARIMVCSDLILRRKKSSKPACFDNAAFLGGIFTELFGKGTHFKELSCIAQGRRHCVFETIK